MAYHQPTQAALADLARALASGVALQRAGRHAEAEQHYRQLLLAWPGTQTAGSLFGRKDDLIVHPQRWISSAYHVTLPDSVADQSAMEGWFTLGDPPFDVPWSDRVRRYIQPREGRLVLFPSYFCHGAVPFAGARAHTTIAFDAVPVS